MTYVSLVYFQLSFQLSVYLFLTIILFIPANQRPPSKSTASYIKITGKPQDIKLRWGQSTILECLADAPGSVVYSWLKDSRPLAMAGRYSMYGPGNLKITTVKEEDSAAYTCKVESGSASAQATANVAVQGMSNLEAMRSRFLFISE